VNDNSYEKQGVTDSTASPFKGSLMNLHIKGSFTNLVSPGNQMGSTTDGKGDNIDAERGDMDHFRMRNTGAGQMRKYGSFRKIEARKKSSKTLMSAASGLINNKQKEIFVEEVMEE